ncbi:hypothetical protein DAPPUDRAFT_236703 [Daphnia pulex]|uniref:Uncharacterized protein n=1 Tax=Daphnia pulex TaxID=6669 RepID=E9G2X4_DAPPU|nr:hypothetical protein DAPPUDRAFT_236703 [Daphnia pulex]|eukprot:EFX86117.1 hypothetical protein DAPPUDRAFT_236703 [Daphnia pulex]
MGLRGLQKFLGDKRAANTNTTTNAAANGTPLGVMILSRRQSLLPLISWEKLPLEKCSVTTALVSLSVPIINKIATPYTREKDLQKARKNLIRSVTATSSDRWVDDVYMFPPLVCLEVALSDVISQLIQSKTPLFILSSQFPPTTEPLYNVNKMAGQHQQQFSGFTFLVVVRGKGSPRSPAVPQSLKKRVAMCTLSMRSSCVPGFQRKTYGI